MRRAYKFHWRLPNKEITSKKCQNVGDLPRTTLVRVRARCLDLTIDHCNLSESIDPVLQSAGDGLAMSDYEDDEMDVDRPVDTDIKFTSDSNAKGKRSAANLPVEAQDSLPW